MRTTRRTALLSALGIGVAGRLPVQQPLAEAATLTFPSNAVSASGRGMAIIGSGGWCAPSELLYDLNEFTWLAEDLISLPEVKVKRGGIRFQ